MLINYYGIKPNVSKLVKYNILFSLFIKQLYELFRIGLKWLNVYEVSTSSGKRKMRQVTLHDIFLAKRQQ